MYSLQAILQTAVKNWMPSDGNRRKLKKMYSKA